MASISRDDVLGPADRPQPVKVAAFLPITFALIGLGVVVIGGTLARPVAVAEQPMIDPIATGSIAAPTSEADLGAAQK